MAMVHEAGPVVLLSESEVGRSLAERLAPAPDRVPCYRSMEELVRGQPLSSVEVLVVQTRQAPRGVLLVALGRMNEEYPTMQKVAVMDGPPPLPVAEYLTACGVDLVWAGTGEERIDEVASIVDRMRERTPWLAGGIPATSAA